MSDPSPTRRALLLIGKPEQAGTDAVREARRLLDAAGYTVDARLLRDWSGNEDRDGEPNGSAAALVVGAGGDGTVRTAAAAAHARQAPLAILPLGTANDLARTLGIPLEVEPALQVLRDGVPRRIDLGRCNGIVYCNVVSLGLSVTVARRLTRERKKRWGPLAYAREMLDSARAFRSLRVRLELDGATAEYRALQVGVASGVTQGGGTRVAKGARINDGLLRVYVIEPQPLPRLLLMALSVKLGAHDLWEGAHFHAARKVRIETRRPYRLNIDGDLLSRTPAEVEILPGALEILVPPEALQREDATA